MDKFFYKLVQANTADAETVACVAAAGKDLLQHYMLLDDEEMGGPECISLDELDAMGAAKLMEVRTVMCVDGSVYTNTEHAYKTSDGNVWMDCDVCDVVFA